MNAPQGYILLTLTVLLFSNDSDLLYGPISLLLIGWIDAFIRRKCSLRVTVITGTDRALSLRTIWTAHPLFNITPYSAHGKICHCCQLYIPILNFIHFKGSDNKILTKIYASFTVTHQRILSSDTSYNYYSLSVRNKVHAIEEIFIHFTRAILSSAQNMFLELN
jgi:hypothetical protein